MIEELKDRNYELLPMPKGWEGAYFGVLIAHKHLDPSDRIGAVPVAHTCAAHGHTVMLLPIVNADKVRTPDAIMDSPDSYWEFKRILGCQTSFKAMIGQANSKADVLWVLSEMELDLETIWRYIRGKLLVYRIAGLPIRLRQVYVLLPSANLFCIETADTLKNQRPT